MISSSIRRRYRNCGTRGKWMKIECNFSENMSYRMD
jgi:hypothetical protein